MNQKLYYLHFKETVDIDEIVEAFAGYFEPVRITQRYSTSFELETTLSLSKITFALDQWFRQFDFNIYRVTGAAYHVSES